MDKSSENISSNQAEEHIPVDTDVHQTCVVENHHELSSVHTNSSELEPDHSPLEVCGELKSAVDSPAVIEAYAKRHTRNSSGSKTNVSSTNDAVRRRTSAVLSKKICNGPKIVTKSAHNTAVLSTDVACETTNGPTPAKIKLKEVKMQKDSGIFINKGIEPPKSMGDSLKVMKDALQGSFGEPSCKSDTKKNISPQFREKSASKLTSSLSKSPKQKSPVPSLKIKQNLTKGVKKSKVDCGCLSEKYEKGANCEKSYEDKNTFAESDGCTLKKSTELSSFGLPSSHSQHIKSQRRSVASRNTSETWEKLLKSSPAKVKSTPKYLNKLKKRLARRKSSSCKGYPLSSMPAFPFCRGRWAPVPPRRKLEDVTPEQRECLFSVLADFNVHVMIQSARPATVSCETKVYCCVYCNFKTGRLGSLMCHLNYCSAKKMESQLKRKFKPQLIFMI